MICFTSQNNKQSVQDQKDRLAFAGNLEFKGKIINSKVYEFGGKNYYMICVKLDYSNVKDFYVLNDACAIKIKTNIATMAAGFLTPDNGVVDYVEVNINHSGKTKYIYKIGTTEEYEFVLANWGLLEKDMNLCN